MKTISICAVVSLILTAGCRNAKMCSVKSYGSEYLVVSGHLGRFDNVCRTVLHELSHKEIIDDNRTRYPYYGEGASTNQSEDGRLISCAAYMKTQDSEGYEYSIKTIQLSGKDPLAIVETTNPEKYILINALFQELAEKGVEVKSAN